MINMTARKIEIMIFLICGLKQTTIALKYRGKIVSQRIVHFENPYVDFDVKYYGDEGYPYMTLKQIVSPYNDLHLMLYGRVYDQTPHLLMNAPMSLCKLLHDEESKKNGTLGQFKVPEIYNFEGKQCPIEQGRIRLTPYAFPSKFETDVNLGCGYMNIESRLLKCGSDSNQDNGGDDDESRIKKRSCVTILKTVSTVFLLNEYCLADEQDIPSWTGVIRPAAA